jgi:hypothetical protein
MFRFHKVCREPRGAVLAEQSDEWTEGCRYMGPELLAKSRIRIVTTEPDPVDPPVATTEALTAQTQPRSRVVDLIPAATSGKQRVSGRIEAARANGAPNHSLGRGMKVGKEELLGLLAAVEWTLQQDEPAVIAAYEVSVRKWIAGLFGLPGVAVERGFPSEAGRPHGLWGSRTRSWPLICGFRLHARTR